MATTYFSLESSPRQTAAGVARPLAALPAKAQPRPLSRQPEAAALPDLVRIIRPGHWSEELVWMILACSGLVLLALSLWL